MRDRGQPILLPPDPAPQVTCWWLEIGPSVSGPMGEVAIGWQDMLAWRALTGIDLQGWEARAIHAMSVAFVAFRSEARKPDCPAPWAGTQADLESDRDRVDRQVRAAFSGLQGLRVKREPNNAAVS